jgi:glyoxylase-like metal-dependent hydrolase (beta-lactamase superfamily II)
VPVATLNIGGIQIAAIRDVDALTPLKDTFDSGDPPPGGIDSLGERFPEDFTADSWRFRDHCFLIRSPGGVVLVDTGVGPADSSAGRWLGVGGTLPPELEAIGVTPADVDHVILTHVHSDHTGWNTVEADGAFVALFPNARYHLHEADVAWARTFDDAEDLREFAEVIAPLEASGQLDTSVEDREVMPGLAIRHAPGHTPGHRVALLDAGDERVLFAGDLLHFTFQLNDVTYGSPADHDPEEGSRTRGLWLDRVETEGMTLATSHVPPAPFGRLVRDGGVVRLDPVRAGPPTASPSSGSRPLARD